MWRLIKNIVGRYIGSKLAHAQQVLNGIISESEIHNQEEYKHERPNYFSSWDVEEKERTIYLLVGSKLARIKVVGRKSKTFERVSLTMACLVEEIEGMPIPEQEQNENKVCETYGDLVPDIDVQWDVIRRALQKYGLTGTMSPVSHTYVDGHLRIISIQNRMKDRRAYNDDNRSFGGFD